MASPNSDFTFSGEHARAKGQEFMSRLGRVRQARAYVRRGRSNTIRVIFNSEKDQASCAQQLNAIYNQVDNWRPKK